MWRRSEFDDLFSIFRDFESLFSRTFPQAFVAPLNDVRLLSPGKRAGESMTTKRREPARSLSGWSAFPAVESYEKDGKLHLRAELPGVDPADVNVSLTGDRLVISGERKSTREVDETDMYVRELSHGTFERCFSVPEGIQAEEVKAEFVNGMLELTLPLPAEVKPKQVKIQITPGDKKRVA